MGPNTKNLLLVTLVASTVPGNSLWQDSTFPHLERSCTRENQPPVVVFQQPCKFGGKGVGEPNAQGQLLSQYPLPAFINCSHRQGFEPPWYRSPTPVLWAVCAISGEWMSSYCTNSRKKKIRVEGQRIKQFHPAYPFTATWAAHSPGLQLPTSQAHQLNVVSSVSRGSCFYCFLESRLLFGCFSRFIFRDEASSVCTILTVNRGHERSSSLCLWGKSLFVRCSMSFTHWKGISTVNSQGKMPQLSYWTFRIQWSDKWLLIS